MKKVTLPKPITILVLTLITTVVWVGLSVYRAITAKPPATVSEDILKPLNPVIDASVIKQVESSIYFEESDIPEIGIENIQITEPTVIPTEAPVTELEEQPTSSTSATEI